MYTRRYYRGRRSLRNNYETQRSKNKDITHYFWESCKEPKGKKQRLSSRLANDRQGAPKSYFSVGNAIYSCVQGQWSVKMFWLGNGRFTTDSYLAYQEHQGQTV